jgi:hypothetical protein
MSSREYSGISLSPLSPEGEIRLGRYAREIFGELGIKELKLHPLSQTRGENTLGWVRAVPATPGERGDYTSRIREGRITIPMELLDRAGLDGETGIILIDTEGGIGFDVFGRKGFHNFFREFEWNFPPEAAAIEMEYKRPPKILLRFGLGRRVYSFLRRSGIY